MTSSAPSPRLVATVSIVASTSWVRLSTVLISMPGGSVRRICVDLGVDSGRHGAAVAADQHQRRADNDLVAVLAGAAGADFAADRHLGDVADPHRNAAARADDDVADVAEVFEASAGAHGDAFAVALDNAGAAAGVVGFDGAWRRHRTKGPATISFAGSGWTWYCLT